MTRSVIFRDATASAANTCAAACGAWLVTVTVMAPLVPYVKVAGAVILIARSARADPAAVVVVGMDLITQFGSG
jgi:hypothetical protein